MEDITEQKQLEKQLFHSQKMEAIGTLAGGIAHDFNNIITVIKSYSELLLNGPGIGEEYRDDIGEIYAASNKAASLTRQLLAFSRKQVLNTSVVNLNDLIGDLSKMLNRIIGEDIRLEVRLNPELPLTMVDSGQVEQVILNLVVNARDAMPDGGTIEIKTESVRFDKRFILPEQREGDFVILYVRDTGTGIDKDMLPHIFEPFFTTKGVDKGTGLGLSVAYGIVTQHRGWITVLSEKGSGSVFMVHIPAWSGDKIESVSTAAEVPVPVLSGKSLLVVEDDSSIRNFVTRILENNGFVVLQAENAEEAINLFSGRIKDVDLLFCDVVLPGMSGLKLAESLLSGNPRLRVLLCSGYLDQRSRRKEIDEKKLNFLQKPYTVSEVIGAVRGLLL
jgi:nitrogen-specific signal transduction histidine kinase